MNLTKDKKIVVALVIALIFAIMAGIMVYFFMAPQRKTVYVFNSSYQAGTVISSDMLTPIQADSSIVVAGQKFDTSTRFITQDELTNIVKTGDSLRVDVTEGLPLMKSMLSITGGNSIEMAMSPSGIAVTVPVNDITGVTNEIAPGAHVNIYASGAGGQTYLIFENMRILQVFKTAAGSLTGVSLEVNNDEAMMLISVVRSSNIHLGLVNGSGYQYVQQNDMHGEHELPEETSAPTETPKEEPKEEKPVEESKEEAPKEETKPEGGN